MKHKSAFLFILLLVLVFGFAAATAQSMETVTTVTLKPGALLAEYAEVGQILDIAALRIHSMPDGYGALALSLSGTDALTAKFKLEKEGVYAQSELLGSQPLYFTWDDIKAFVSKQMEAYAQAQPMGMPFDMGMLQSMMDGTLTQEQMFEMMGIDEELLAIINDIQARQIAESGSFSVEGSDVANLKTVIEITGDDLLRVINLPMVRELMASQYMTGADAAQEDTDQQIDMQLAQIKQMIAQSNVAITASVYTLDEEFVAFILDFSAAVDNGGGATLPIGVHVSVTRTSIDTAKFYQLTVKLTQADQEFLNQLGSLYVSDAFVTGQYVFYVEPDVPVLEVELNCDRSQPDHISAALALTLKQDKYSQAQSVFIVLDKQQADNVKDVVIDVYVGGSVDEIKKAFAETSLISLKLHIVTQPDSGFFAALQSAVPETSVQLLKMSDTELQTYVQSLEQSLLMTLLTVVENLPPDLSNALMQSMNGF